MKIVEAEVIDETKPHARKGERPIPPRRAKEGKKTPFEVFLEHIAHAAKFDTRKGPMPR